MTGHESLIDARPDPGRVAPEGFHFEAVEEDSRWRVATDEETSERCRAHRGGCVMPPAAALNRGRWSSLQGKRLDQWWLYCDRHMYGRWVEVDKVMRWRLVRHDGGDIGTDLAKRFGEKP